MEVTSFDGATLQCVLPTAPWTDAMQRMYACVCAGNLSALFEEANVNAFKALTKREWDALSLRFARTPGLDLDYLSEWAHGVARLLEERAAGQ